MSAATDEDALREAARADAAPGGPTATAAGVREAPEDVAVPADVDLAVQRVRLRLTLRLAWLAHLAEQGLTDVEIATGDLDQVADECAWRRATAPAEVLGALDVAERSLRGPGGRLARLRETFGLSPAEDDVLHVCVAVAVDPGVGRSFTRLHRSPDRAFPTEATVARLFDRHPPAPLGPESPLRLWGLVRLDDVAPGEAAALGLDEAVLGRLLGQPQLDAPLVGVARSAPDHPPLSSWPVADVAARCLAGDAGGGEGGQQPDPVRVVVRGRPGSGRRSFAATVCRALGLGALHLDADVVAEHEWPGCFAAAQRQAFLDRHALVWGGARAGGPWPRRTPLFPVQFLLTDDGCEPPAVRDLPDVVVDLPAPGTADRHRLWHEYVPASDGWPEPERSDLVDRPHAVIADIAHLARVAPGTPAQAQEALRARTRARLGPLVTPMPLPYRRGDLVVADRVSEALDFLLLECRERRTLWDDGGARARLFPQAGLVALLAGPPGVGKTMAAQVLAAELGVDLLRVDLAETVSKYVGETAKNLDRVLREAGALDAVLLCDEADTLFGRRTEVRDAHDRYANSDTNYLLQAIETYPGIALLATNRKKLIDEAFLRRLRHVIDIAEPDEPARLRLWTALLADVDPEHDATAAAGLLERLARSIPLTGAEIKHAVLNAALRARGAGHAVGPEDVLAGLDRELAKQGRSLSSLERRRVLDA